MRLFLRYLAPVGALVLGLGALPAFSANGSIDPDPRSPSLGELLAREESARAKVERAPQPAASPASAPVVSAPAAPRGSVRQVHPAFNQPAVTVLVPGSKLSR